MRKRFPGFGFALCGPLALLLNGCGGSLHLGSKAEAPPRAPDAPAGAAGAAEGEMAMQSADAAPAPAPPPSSPSPSPVMAATTDAAVATAPGPTASAGAAQALAPRREMLDIEANVQVQVKDVKAAVKALHALSARVGGVVTAERVDSASAYGSATMTLRVPSSAAKGVFDDLEKLGTVLNQTVTARDISKEYFDAGLRLSSLEATQRRYEEILGKAGKVEEILRIEQELGRIRTEIEQVKGNLRWLSDRAARATLHISLSERAPEIVYTEEPQPKFFPGLRAPLLVDFGKSREHTYAGGGVSIRFLRALSLDLDVLKRFGSEERGPDALVATVGGETYSNLLGGGKRRFLNPYLGWRAGYARFADDDQAVVGATLGLELYKNPWFTLDLEARNYLAFGGDRGGHYALVPALSAGIAF